MDEDKGNIDSDEIWKRHDKLDKQEKMQLGIYQIYYGQQNDQ
jgi:hypothetical protein